MDHNSPPALIVGTGAMACLFAARLSAAGFTPAVMGSWPAGLDALEQHGVTLVEPDGQERTYPVEVIRSSKPRRTWPYALVLVKAWQTAGSAERLAGFLAPDGLAITLQNGYGNREALAAVLGAERVALGTTTFGATLLAPGRVRPGGEGQINLQALDRLTPLVDILCRSGFKIEMSPDIDSLLWGKLVINAAINPLAALLRVTNGELLTRPAARALMKDLAQEAAAAAAAQGVRLPYDSPERVVENIARRTAANRSSMLQDVLNGRMTEIDAINGAVVRLGRQAGIPTPLNEMCWRLVQALHPVEEKPIEAASSETQSAVPDESSLSV